MEQIDMKPTTISWKKSSEEIELYKIIDTHSSKGAFIKDTLIQALLHKNNTPVSKTEVHSEEINDIFDSL